MPTQLVAKLRYNGTHVLVADAEGLAYTMRSWRCNDCHAPDGVSMVGNRQPYGWDQISAFYKNASVLTSRITVRAFIAGSPPAPADNYKFCIGILKDDEQVLSDPMGTYLDITNQPGCKWTYLATSNAQFPATVTIRDSYNAKRDTASSQPRTDYDMLPSVSSPDNIFWFNVFVAKVCEGTQLAGPDIQLEVMIDYVIKFTQPLGITQSVE